jgi:hypothetical protein
MSRLRTQAPHQHHSQGVLRRVQRARPARPMDLVVERTWCFRIAAVGTSRTVAEYMPYGNAFCEGR